jgi:predicted ATP-grasp superfamily ATP-dependent carboligase
MKNKKSVLIIGLSTQTELAFIRSLGKHGIKIYGLGINKNNIGFFSKYLTKGYISPTFEEEEKFIDFVEKILEKHKIDYVMAHGFAALENVFVVLNKYRARIEKTSKLMFPPGEIFDKVLDKNKTLQLAKNLDIPIPKTIVIYDINELDNCKNLRFPVVVKPSSRNYQNHNLLKMDFRREYFHNFHALQEFVSKFKPYQFFPVMIQEYCNGEEIGFPILMNKGKCVACMQYKILRTLPVNGGTPIYRETVKMNPLLKEYSVRLLKAMKWEGVAEIDYFADNKDDNIKLLEVNGRFWGSLALSIYSGIDFPYLLYKCAEGSNEINVFDYKVGTKCRILCADTGWLSDILFGRVAGEEIGRRPSKPKAILDYLRSFHPSVRYDFETLDDPLPGIIDLILASTSLFSGVRLPFKVNVER